MQIANGFNESTKRSEASGPLFFLPIPRMALEGAFFCLPYVYTHGHKKPLERR